VDITKQFRTNPQDGFSLLELMAVVAVIGILASIALYSYQKYSARATSAEIIIAYDEIRTRAISAAEEAGIDLCADPSVALINRIPTSPHVDMAIEKVSIGNNNPLILHINANVSQHGAYNTDVARQVFHLLNRLHHVAPGYHVSPSVVSFGALLSNNPCDLLKVALQQQLKQAATQQPPTPTTTANTAHSLASQPVPTGPGAMNPEDMIPASVVDLYNGDCKTDIMAHDPQGRDLATICGDSIVVDVCMRTCAVETLRRRLGLN